VVDVVVVLVVVGHGQEANASAVNVVSRPLANDLVEQNHCHGLTTVRASCNSPEGAGSVKKDWTKWDKRA